MKTLTKPVKSRLSSPCIYGYESDTGSHWAPDPPDTTVIYGDPPEIVWISHYYICDPGGHDGCSIGDTARITYELTP